MGYESKIIFVNNYNFNNSSDLTYGHIMAQVDMSKMGYSEEVERFKRLFDKETPFYLYLPDGVDEEGNGVEIETTVDRYGERLKYADIDKLLIQINAVIAEDEKRYNERGYYAFYVLRDMLETFKRNFPSVYVVHYGY